MKYIETYIVGDNKFAIEDYKDGRPDKDHLFAHHPHRRFRLWRNSCGLGQSDTLKAAHKFLYDHISSGERTALAGYKYKVALTERNIKKLGSDVDNLRKFKK